MPSIHPQLAAKAVPGSTLHPTLEALGVKTLRPTAALDALLSLLAAEARASPPSLTLERHCQQLQYIGMHGTALALKLAGSLLVAAEGVSDAASVTGPQDCVGQLLPASQLHLALGHGEGCELHKCLAEAGMRFVDPRVR